MGAMAGEETCFLFIRDVVASVARPLLELRGLAKIGLDPGQKGTVRFELAAGRSGFSGRGWTSRGLRLETSKSWWGQARIEAACSATQSPFRA